MNIRSVVLLSFLSLSGFGFCTDDRSNAGASALIKPVSGVKYAPFYPDKWKEMGIPTEMTVWKGEEIAFFTLDDSPDPKMVTELVNRLDMGWRTYRELVGRNPRPFKMHGKLPIIAAIPEGLSCGAGCGFVGATGIELCLFYGRDFEKLEKDPTAVPHYIFYEMGRNFYVFGERHTYFATGFAVFMRYVCMDATDSTDVEAWERKQIEALESKVKDATNLSFLEIFTSAGDDARRKHAKAAGLSNSQNSNNASVMLHLRKKFGGDPWVKLFYHAMSTADPFPVNSENAPYLQSLNLLVAASIAAKEDLTPLFVERYRFPIPQEDAEKLAKIDWEDEKPRIAEIVKELGRKPVD